MGFRKKTWKTFVAVWANFWIFFFFLFMATVFDSLALWNPFFDKIKCTTKITFFSKMTWESENTGMFFLSPFLQKTSKIVQKVDAFFTTEFSHFFITVFFFYLMLGGPFRPGSGEKCFINPIGFIKVFWVFPQPLCERFCRGRVNSTTLHEIWTFFFNLHFTIKLLTSLQMTCLFFDKTF